MRSLITLLIVVLVVGGIGYGGYAYYQKSQAPVVTFRTAALKHGELLATISATGTVEPEEVVDIGAQVQGRIVAFGEDPHNPGHDVDYNSQVEENTVLARVDPSVYQSDVDSQTAALDSAKAAVERSEADVLQYQAKLTQATNDWKRAQEAGKGVLSEADYDAAQAGYESAKANLAVGKAIVSQSKAAVVQAEAALKRSKQNLEYCTILSPVKGVIIDRRVNKGQTVVSSLSAPSLFLIAKDLTKIQIWASVNEADISRIRPDQPVTFTVDAHPDRVFKGAVGKVRMSASVTQNVVTYPVEINAENSDLALRPYETANVQFEVERLPDALLVPNVALRYSPSSLTIVSPEVRDAYMAQMSGNRGAGPSGGQSATRSATTQPGGGGGKSRGPGGKGGKSAEQRGTVWVQDGTFVKPIRVKIGPTDSVNTAVLSDELKDGDVVVTGEIHSDTSSSDDAKNPFMPQFPRGGPGGGGSSSGGRRGG